MKLEPGKISTKELASWFETSYGTFRNKKKKYLEELREYCRFEVVYGGVEITDVYISEYVKPNNNYQEVESHVPEEWDESGFDTKKNVSEKIYGKYKDKLTIAPSTTYNYVQKASNKLYGKANDYENAGTIGNCWYKLGVREPNGKVRLFTPEEKEMRAKIKAKYQPKQKKEQEEEIRDTLKIKHTKGDLSDGAYKEALADLESWRTAYLLEFEETLPEGCTLGYGTFKYEFEKPTESAF